MARAESLGSYFQERLKEVQTRWPRAVADVRGKGLLIGVELADPGLRGLGREGFAKKIYSILLDAGIRFGYGHWRGVFRLCPPLTVTRRQIDRAVQGFEDSLRAALRPGPSRGKRYN